MMKTFRLMSGACILAMSVPGHAAAQEGATSPSDIIVTATRREQRLQDVPLSVTAVGDEALRARGISNVNDISPGKIAGLTTVPANGAETQVSIQMRGYGSSDVQQGTGDQPVAFYIDGINLPRAQGGALDLITPERIEILRGPQGQLFGRNAEAGVIQVVSRRPTGDLNGELRGGFGNFGSRDVKGRLDLPELAGFKVQLSGMFRKHDGYFKNVKSALLENITPITSPYSSFHFKRGDYDHDFRRLRTYGGRIAVERDFGDLNMFYTYDNTWSRDDQSFPFISVSDRGGTIENPNGGSTIPLSGPATIFTTDGGSFQQFPLDLDHYPDRAPFPIPSLDYITKARGHSLTLAYPVSDELTLKSLTGLRRTINYGGATTSLATSPFQPWQTIYLNSRVFSQEFQGIYDVDNFNLTVGAIYFQEKVQDERDSGLSTNCPVGFPTAPCTPGGGPSRQTYYSSANGGFTRQFSRTEAYAGYGQASWTPGILDERLQLTAGLRYSHDTKRAERTIFNGVILGTALRNAAKTDRFDPAVMVKYKWTDDVNTYFRYASGFRDGGANVRSLVFSAYEAEKMKSYELGLKSQWFNRRVTLNVAAFHYTVENQQQSLQTTPSTNPSISDTFNVVIPYKAKGIELELSARLLPGLSLSANYTYIHGNKRIIGIDPNTLKSFAATNPGFVTTGNLKGGLMPSAADIAAHPGASFLQLLPVGAPKHAGSVALDFDQQAGPGTFKAHLEWVRSSVMLTSAPYRLLALVNATGTIATPVPRYNPGVFTNRVNGRIGYSGIPLAGRATGEINFWVKNLFDHVDPASSFAAGNGLNAATPRPQAAVYLAAPRTLGVEFGVKF